MLLLCTCIRTMDAQETTPIPAAISAFDVIDTLGGNGMDRVLAVARVSDEEFIVAGVTTSANFPRLYPSPWGWAGGRDGFITRYRRVAGGVTRVSSTCLGGSKDDWISTICVDTDGSIVVAGTTASPDFPVKNQIVVGNHPGGESDGFIARLSPTCDRLLFCSTIGGSAGDTVTSLVLGAMDRVTIGGMTRSADFPATPGPPLQPSPGSSAGFVTIVSNASVITASRCLGGGSTVTALAMLHGGGDALLVGGTTTGLPDPGGSPGFDRTMHGPGDAFLMVMTPDTLRTRTWTLVGGSAADGITTVADAGAGGILCAGWTGSTDLPMPAGAASWQPASRGRSDGFVMTFDTTLHTLTHGTHIGGIDEDSICAVTLDAQGFPIVAGVTRSGDFPASCPAGAKSGPLDAFVARFSPGLGNLTFATCRGTGNGTAEKYAMSGAAVACLSSQTVAMGGAVQRNWNDEEGAVVLTSLDVPLPKPFLQVLGSTSFCPGDSVILQTSQPFASYRWSTGDTTRRITVRTAGEYWVSVTAVSAMGCPGASDTILVTVHTPPAPRITGRTQLCRGALDTLDAGGGQAAYLWSTGERTRSIIVSTGGSFTVTVTSVDGCSGTSPEFTVTLFDVPPISITPQEPVVTQCPGGTLTLTAEAGFTGYRWLRNGQPVGTGPTYTAVDSGRYEVEAATVEGCIARSTVMHLVYHPVTIPTVTAQWNTLTCSPAQTYQWMRDGAAIPGATEQQYTVTQTGRHAVTVSDNNGCTATSRDTTITSLRASTVVGLTTEEAFVPLVGDTSDVRIMLHTSDHLPSTSMDYVAVIEYDRRGLLPMFAFTPQVIDDSTARCTYRDSRPGAMTAGVLAVLRFAVYVGPRPCSRLSIRSLTWSDPNVRTTLDPAPLTLCVASCDAGGTRGFRTAAGAQLAQNHPNPFNGMTRIDFVTVEPGRTQVLIDDLLGRHIATLYDGDPAPGAHGVLFQSGELPSGIYRCILRTPSEQRIRHMLITR